MTQPTERIEVGAELSPITYVVDAERMKVFTLLTNDPNPIHWDHHAPGVIEAGGKLVNQGGLNVGYIHNAVLRWAGTGWAVNRTQVRFRANAFEGDRVTAGGTVTTAPTGPDDPLTIEVWLRREDDGAELVSGTVELKPIRRKG